MHHIHNVKSSGGNDYNSNRSDARREKERVHFISDKERWNSDFNEATTTHNEMETAKNVNKRTTSAITAEQVNKECIHSTNKQFMEIDRKFCDPEFKVDETGMTKLAQRWQLLEGCRALAQLSKDTTSAISLLSHIVSSSPGISFTGWNSPCRCN